MQGSGDGLKLALDEQAQRLVAGCGRMPVERYAQDSRVVFADTARVGTTALLGQADFATDAGLRLE